MCNIILTTLYLCIHYLYESSRLWLLPGCDLQILAWRKPTPTLKRFRRKWYPMTSRHLTLTMIHSWGKSVANAKQFSLKLNLLKIFNLVWEYVTENKSIIKLQYWMFDFSFSIFTDSGCTAPNCALDNNHLQSLIVSLLIYFFTSS